MTSVARHDKWEGGDARISEHGAHGGLRETAVGGTSASWSGIRPGRDEGSCAFRASREIRRQREQGLWARAEDELDWKQERRAEGALRAGTRRWGEGEMEGEGSKGRAQERATAWRGALGVEITIQEQSDGQALVHHPIAVQQ